MAGNMENRVAQQAQQLMKEFARPTIGISASCIVLDANARNYELKHIHFNMLPSFHGVTAEDPLTFMRDFYSTIQTFPLQGLTEDQLRMRCFPYTLKDAAKSWFMTLAPGSLTTWDAVYNKFIGKFYSHAKTAELRGKIATFAQMEGEAFHEAWDRFKGLLIQCPHHRFPLELLTQFFYDGLTQPCQAMVDNAAGGAMGEKTPEETYDLYEMLGTNSQQKSVRDGFTGMYEVNSNTELSMQLSELTKQMKMMCSMLINQKQTAPTEVCSICGIAGHSHYVCPSRQDFADCLGQANAINFYNQQPYDDPYSNTSNPSWRSHPNFSWTNNQNQNQAETSFEPKKPTLEETVQSFVQATQTQFQNVESRFQNIEASMKMMETQMGQVAEAMQSLTLGKPSSQLEQANVITMINGGKVIDDKVDDVINNSNVFADVEEEVNARRAIFPILNPPVNYIPPPPYDPPVPFPGRLRLNKVVEKPCNDNEQTLVLDVFLPEKSSEMIENCNEDLIREEIKEEVDSKKLPHSFRYASVGNDSFFPVMISSSLTGIEEEELIPLQDHALNLKMIELSNENKSGFKIDVVDVMMEFSEEPLNTVEAILVEDDELEDAESFNCVYQLEAPQFYKPLPVMKEPEHRKTKIRLKDGEP